MLCYCNQLTITWEANRCAYEVNQLSGSYLKCIIAYLAFIQWKLVIFFLFKWILPAFAQLPSLFDHTVVRHTIIIYLILNICISLYEQNFDAALIFFWSWIDRFFFNLFMFWCVPYFIRVLLSSDCFAWKCLETSARDVFLLLLKFIFKPSPIYMLN